MSAEEKQLLKQILANQVVLFRQIEKIQEKLKNSTSMKGYGSVVTDLEREASKVKEYL